MALLLLLVFVVVSATFRLFSGQSTSEGLFIYSNLCIKEFLVFESEFFTHFHHLIYRAQRAELVSDAILGLIKFCLWDETNFPALAVTETIS